MGVSVGMITSRVGDDGMAVPVGIMTSVAMGVTCICVGTGVNVSGKVVGKAKGVISVGVAVTVGEATIFKAGMLYSICNNGAPAAFPSYDSATLLPPLPVMIMTMEFPEVHLGRLTISCMIEFRFGVCCAVPMSPAFVQEMGVQETLLDVRGLAETLRAIVLNAEAFGLASAAIFNLTVVLDVSSTLNWMYAFVIVAPCGMVTPVKRIPITWALLS